MSSGLYHVGIVSANGEAYTFGGGSYGCLGQDDDQPSSIPCVVKGLAGRVTSLVCGDNHSLAVTDDGSCFSWGFNDSGQLGLGDSYPRFRPTKITKEHGLHVGGQDVEILSLAAGRSHTILYGEGGEVFAMGAGDKGQLGLGDYRGHITPQMNTHPTLWDPKPSAAGKVAKVAACGDRTLYVMEAGTVYTCGASPLQLPAGVESHSLYMEEGLGDVHVVGASLSPSHTMVVGRDGEGLYSWGKGGEGVLGHGSERDEARPRQVAYFQKAKVGAVSACHGFSSAVADGELHTWGSNAHGRLGLDSLVTQMMPTKVSPQNAHFDGSEVISLEAGVETCVAITEAGGVFVWGYQGNGWLGLGDPEPGYDDITAPVKLTTFSQKAATGTQAEDFIEAELYSCTVSQIYAARLLQVFGDSLSNDLRMLETARSLEVQYLDVGPTLQRDKKDAADSKAWGRGKTVMNNVKLCEDSFVERHKKLMQRVSLSVLKPHMDRRRQGLVEKVRDTNDDDAASGSVDPAVKRKPPVPDSVSGAFDSERERCNRKASSLTRELEGELDMAAAASDFERAERLQALLDKIKESEILLWVKGDRHSPPEVPSVNLPRTDFNLSRLQLQADSVAAESAAAASRHSPGAANTSSSTQPAAGTKSALQQSPDQLKKELRDAQGRIEQLERENERLRGGSSH